MNIQILVQRRQNIKDYLKELYPDIFLSKKQGVRGTVEHTYFNLGYWACLDDILNKLGGLNDRTQT